ncbi:hypothetical protein LTR64_004638 [Lithohypha guttulata]|uniref:uncharacterized protein n=1 Tax=Lithohypha guttulata TaxID=1690604 RepID=UPI002DE0B402|nr:hypothetical protein LTR51_006064 [Lithohypha guttulata]
MDMTDPSIQTALSGLAELEKDFAAVELDAMRRKEYAHKALYEKRSKHLAKLPSFWPTVFIAGPQEIQETYEDIDEQVLNSIKNFTVSRYQITSETEGEPRSLRFTFEFDTSKQETKLFEDTTVTKDFEFVSRDDLPEGGGYVSKPVNFKWTKAGKKKELNKMLDLAEQLYQAERALVEDGDIEQKEREGLWQHEKLRSELEKEEDKATNGEDQNASRSFLEWFGYRGVVMPNKEGEKATSKKKAEAINAEEDEDQNENVEADGLLEVEIYPAGGDIAQVLAEDMWPNCVDYFIQAHTDDGDDDISELEDDEADDDAPDLVEFAGFDNTDDNDARPNKKQRRS